MAIYAEADDVVYETGWAVDASMRLMTVDVMRDRSADRHMASRIDCTMGHYDVDPSSDLPVHARSDLVHAHCAHVHYHKESSTLPSNRILDYS
jgi:hypothetical protein